MRNSWEWSQHCRRSSVKRSHALPSFGCFLGTRDRFLFIAIFVTQKNIYSIIVHLISGRNRIHLCVNRQQSTVYACATANIFSEHICHTGKISTWLQRISILVSLDNTIDPSSITPLQGHAQVQMSGRTPVNTNTQLTNLLDYETSYSQTIS